MRQPLASSLFLAWFTSRTNIYDTTTPLCLQVFFTIFYVIFGFIFIFPVHYLHIFILTTFIRVLCNNFSDIFGLYANFDADFRPDFNKKKREACLRTLGKCRAKTSLLINSLNHLKTLPAVQ